MSNKIDDIGIYTNIYESGKREKYGNKLYCATCKVCGAHVEKKLVEIKRSNKVCRHKNQIDSENDMPKGWVRASELNKKIYDTWKAMLRRTTLQLWGKYPTYEGTTVDESWRTLSVFVEDIKYLQGYDEWINSTKRSMMLDKDTLVEGNKHYSKDTCCFITILESNKDVHKRNPNMAENGRNAVSEKYSKPIKIINNQTGEERIFSSVTVACKIMGWSRGGAYKVLSDKYPHHNSIKGWSIVKI